MNMPATKVSHTTEKRAITVPNRKQRARQHLEHWANVTAQMREYLELRAHHRKLDARDEELDAIFGPEILK